MPRAASASAALTYYVDTANQQIIFNGSWSGGTPNSSNYVDWEIRNLSVEGSSSAVNPLSGSVQDTGGTASNSLIFFGAAVGQQPGQGVDLLFDIIFNDHDGSASTLTIDNLVFSYSSFAQEARDYISQLPTLQTAMTLSDGTGYSDITYAAIPEPAHVGLLLGCGISALLIRRRMKNRKETTASR